MSQAKVMQVNSRRAILCAVFAGVHLPLLALIGLFLVWENPSVVLTLGMTLLATLLAAIGTLGLIWRSWPSGPQA